MSRPAPVTKALVLLALVLLCAPAKAQITIPDPGGILGKILRLPKPKPSTNAPANQIAPPANDSFASREQLVGTDITVHADNRGATVEAGEPEHRTGFKNEHTVWWTWTAPDTGRVTLDTLGGVSDTGFTNLVVYTGNSLDTLLPVMRGPLSSTKNYQVTFPVEGGRSYQIVSAGSASGYGLYGQTGFNLHFSKTTLPAPVLGRDNFADRALLKGNEAMAVANNEQTTVEYGEPEHRTGSKNEHTVWWTWTAPDTGRVTLDTLGGVSDTGFTNLVVYTGNSLDTLLPVMRGPLSSTKNYQVTFPVEGGRSYQIVSAGSASGYGLYGQTGFNLHFSKTTLPAPVLGRDNFADRALLKGNEAMAVANNEQTTLETDEPAHTPGEQNLHTVWWTWTAPATGKVTIDTLKLGVIPTALTFYQGDALADLVPVVRTRGLNEGDKLVLPVANGQTYQVVSNGGSGQVGFSLHFTPNSLPPPVVGRDNFADRAPLKGAEAMAVANNEQASIETDEPDHTPGQKNTRTVWWTWTAPTKGQVAIDTLKNVSGTQSTALAVYTGDALAGLVPVAQKNAATLDYSLGFSVKAGTAYQIVVNGGDGGSVGQVGFNLHFHPAPPDTPEAKPIPKPKPKRKAAV